MRILVFGDSITYGKQDNEGGWVQRLRKFLDKKNSVGASAAYSVYNLGISVNATSNLLERFESEAKARAEGQDLVIIIGIGLCDTKFFLETGGLEVSPEEFRSNIEKIIFSARKFSEKIVFVGLLPVDDEKLNPIPWIPGISYKSEYVEQYNGILKSVCKKNKIPFIDLYPKFSKLDYKSMLADGYHPNSKGHRKIFSIVKNFLVRKRII